MSALELLIVLSGVAFMLVYMCIKHATPRATKIIPTSSRRKDKLDDVDEFVLWGEVNNDRFFDIM